MRHVIPLRSELVRWLLLSLAILAFGVIGIVRLPGTDASTLAAQLNSNTELVYGRWDSEPVGAPPTEPIGTIA